MDAKSLGPVIRKWRIESGLTQQELGDKAGLPKRIVGILERGERTPERSEIVQLSEALGKDPAELLTFWYRNELVEVGKMRAARSASPEENDFQAPPDLSSKTDRIIDQMAALAKELYRESRADYQKAFLDWLSQSNLPNALPPPSPTSRPRRRVGRKRGATKA